MTFEELFHIWKSAKAADVKRSTLMAYSDAWRWFADRIGSAEISTFGRIEARILLSDMMEAGLAATVCKERIGLVKRMLRFAALELGEKIAPMEWGLRYPRVKSSRVECFTAKETAKLVGAICAECEKGEYGRLAALISILTGMRMGEVLALQWQDIDFKRGTLTVQRNVTRCDVKGKTMLIVETPKTVAGEREVPMLPVLRRVLQRYGGNHKSPTAFIIGGDTTPRWPRCIRESYVRFLRRHGLPKVKFHGLRHTYATLLVESGSDLKTVAVMMGHADVTTTMNLYVHPSTTAKMRAARKAFRMLNKV